VVVRGNSYVRPKGRAPSGGLFVCYLPRESFALASGEDPGWVAKMLGHTTLTMLMTRYYRYVPNLTRQPPRWTPKTGQSWTPENRPVR
jgi:integrase